MSNRCFGEGKNVVSQVFIGRYWNYRFFETRTEENWNKIIPPVKHFIMYYCHFLSPYGRTKFTLLTCKTLQVSNWDIVYGKPVLEWFIHCLHSVKIYGTLRLLSTNEIFDR